ncbi:hydantoinase/oxoprolinase N-terminal domain-containing protein [Jiangella endophytica]|uniref:hydantoinase/oxoprolinase N-terminal domain-containing protein n=1 Tax=Jiangella endophytica TaxID=1623398 RepID=UPI000E3413D8|nr:hydantoinase/oxoprolinase family protein [Jiangella endophytica]
MRTLRVGVDVGGTNTDAAAVDRDGTVVARHKATTSGDLMVGIRQALAAVLADVDRQAVTRLVLGTTQAVNAIVERRMLARVGVLRIGAPATSLVPPFTGWPGDLVEQAGGPVAMVRGGHDHEGKELAPLDEDAVAAFAAACAHRADAVAVAATGSVVNADHEQRAADMLDRLLPSCTVTPAHRVGGPGLIERENAAILNGALTGVIARLVRALGAALRELGLDCATYLTENDGTLLTADRAARYPVRTIASGPTNSMRGAHHLSGLDDAVVVDVGGSSTDVGVLSGGFPRVSTMPTEIGGVRTNYLLPDLISSALGGGSVVRPAPDGGYAVGPQSVGAAISTDALIFGGAVLTLSDVSVVAGRTAFGTVPASQLPVDGPTAAAVVASVDRRLAELTDRIRASAGTLPLVAVGGAAHLVPDELPGIRAVVRPADGAVANAVGAAVAEASGTAHRVYRFDLTSRRACLDEARQLAHEAAVRAGAAPDRVRITRIFEVPLAHLPGDSARVVVTAAGPLAEP